MVCTMDGIHHFDVPRKIILVIISRINSLLHKQKTAELIQGALSKIIRLL